jgi:hypothetical protein
MRAVRITIVSLASVLGLVFVACSGSVPQNDLFTEISATDLDTADGGATSSRGSARGDASSAASPVGCTSDACALPSAEGFSLVLFGDATQPCPTAFAATDMIESPTPARDACTCGACSAAVDCSTGLIPSYLDDGDGSCRKSGVAVHANDGACRNQKATFGTNASIGSPKAVVGACVAPGIASRASVATNQKRLCTPAPSTCPELACSAPPAMRACLVKDGDVECPASAPTKHVLGADFTLSCADCGCDVDATCAGEMKFYAKTDCHGSPFRTLHVGACTETEQETFKSTRWVGKVGSRRCKTEPPPAPAVSLTGARTVCCS